jgi:hypothetical protein
MSEKSEKALKVVSRPAAYLTIWFNITGCGERGPARWVPSRRRSGSGASRAQESPCAPAGLVPCSMLRAVFCGPQHVAATPLHRFRGQALRGIAGRGRCGLLKHLARSARGRSGEGGAARLPGLHGKILAEGAPRPRRLGLCRWILGKFGRERGPGEQGRVRRTGTAQAN